MPENDFGSLNVSLVD